MSVALNHIDCETPRDEESSVGENGDVFPGCMSRIIYSSIVTHSFPIDWAWKFMFSHQVYSHITDALLSAKAPSYETVLDLDRRVRQTTLPAVRLYLKPDEADYSNPALTMKGWLLSQYRSIGKQTCPLQVLELNQVPICSLQPCFTSIGKSRKHFRVVYRVLMFSQNFLCASFIGPSGEPPEQSICSVIPCSQ